MLNCKTFSTKKYISNLKIKDLFILKEPFAVFKWELQESLIAIFDFMVSRIGPIKTKLLLLDLFEPIHDTINSSVAATWIENPENRIPEQKSGTVNVSKVG